jgi:hypothetical protein
VTGRPHRAIAATSQSGPWFDLDATSAIGQDRAVHGSKPLRGSFEMPKGRTAMAKTYKKAKAAKKATTKKRKVPAKAKKGAAKKRTTRRDPCAAERAKLERDQNRAAEIRDFLPDAPATQRPRLEAQLATLEQQTIPADIRKLQACERLHPSR